MEIARQKSRYYPPKGSNYYDLNTTLSEYLDEFKSHFIGKKILDIGAGEIPFKDYYEGLNVKTCDIQNNSDNSIDYIIIPGQKLPFNNEAFDVIFLFDVLEHVENEMFFLSECNRILSSGGMIVANIPFMYRFHEIPYDYRRYTPSGLKSILDTSGFNLSELKAIGSLYFVAQTLLLEHHVVINNYFKKVIIKIIIKLLKVINQRKDVSTVSPFSFFWIAQKKK